MPTRHADARIRVGYGCNGLYKVETGHTSPANSAEGHSYFADVVFNRT